MHNTIGAIILAAGRGSRMQLAGVNKVTLLLNKKPLIHYIIDLLERIMVTKVVVVVGYAKESVISVLSNHNVIFSEQTEQLGTAHAVLSAIKDLPDTLDDVFVLQGDDSMFYSQEILQSLIKAHKESQAKLTFLTITVTNPKGLGRIMRDDTGQLLSIVEEKDATDIQRQNREINPACYLFDIAFLKKYLSHVEKSSATGEYYLTSLIDIAVKNKEKIQTVRAGAIQWRGVNTPEELLQAEQMVIQS